MDRAIAAFVCLSVTNLLACDDDTVNYRRPAIAHGGALGTSGYSSGGAAAGGTTNASNGGSSIAGSSDSGGASGGSAVGGFGSSGGSSGAATGGTLPFILGADISSVDEEMDQGITYQDTDGTPKSIFDILRSHGFNFVRLRTFVKPMAAYGYAYGNGGSCIKAEAYCDLEHTLAMAQRAKAADLGILLNLHYSDNWADPGNQIIPEEWRKSSTIEELGGHVQTYTRNVVAAMISGGARPDIVQLGNEITTGMLKDIPNGTTDCWGNNVSANAIGGSVPNWRDLGVLLKAGAAGVKSVDSAIRIMVHIENTKSASGVLNWVTNARAQEVPFDIVGLSCYEAFQGEPAFWQAAFNALANAFPTLSFAIAEYNPQRTAANMLMHDMPNGRGLGTFFWEPTLSGSWGSALFTTQGTVKRAKAADFAEFDAIASSLGLN